MLSAALPCWSLSQIGLFDIKDLPYPWCLLLRVSSEKCPLSLMKWFIAAVLQYLDSNQVLWFWGPWTESYTYLQSYVHVMSQTIHEVWLIKQRWQRRQREHDLKKELRLSEMIISRLLQVTGVFLKLSPAGFPMLLWGAEIIQSLEQRGLTAESTVVFIAPFEFRNISFAREWVVSPEPSQCYRNCNISDFVFLS